MQLKGWLLREIWIYKLTLIQMTYINHLINATWRCKCHFFDEPRLFCTGMPSMKLIWKLYAIGISIIGAKVLWGNFKFLNVQIAANKYLLWVWIHPILKISKYINDKQSISGISTCTPYIGKSDTMWQNFEKNFVNTFWKWQKIQTSLSDSSPADPLFLK